MEFSLVEQLFGPILIGAFINVFLWGTVTMQYIHYLSNFKKDRIAIKLLVHALFLMDTMNSVFNMVYVYLALVRHFGDAERIIIFDTFAQTDPVLTGLIAFTVQLFFAWRVQRLVGRPWLTAIIVTGSVVQLAAAIVSTVQGAALKDIPLFHQLEASVIVWLGGAALTDVVIAVSLVLHFSKRRTGFHATNEVLDRISLLTMETGALTSLVAVADLATFLVNGNSALYILFNYPLAKLYSNSLFVSLNSRSTLIRPKNSSSTTNHNSVPLNFMAQTALQDGPNASNYAISDRMDVKIVVEQHTDETPEV